MTALILIVYGISIAMVLLYFAYPLWLGLSSQKTTGKAEKEDIHAISLILLTYNGIAYLKDKVPLLLNELDNFSNSELIIIDGNSSDGTQEFLQSTEVPGKVRIVTDKEHRGIPFAMNLGVSMAKYEHIVFCDQRQIIAKNSILKIIEPLRDLSIGAVSSCISHIDKSLCCSWIRRHENFIKARESVSGNLIGVYGPLYAIRKCAYRPVPEDIILDDLYLSLKIMENKRVLIQPGCSIIDDGIAGIYTYDRARRYLKGFIQILRDKTLWKNLNRRQQTMLVWHKYLRLVIPVSLFLSYLITGLYGLNHIAFLSFFILSTLVIVISLIPGLSQRLQPLNYIRINFLYFIAVSDISLSYLIGRKI